MKTLSFVFVMLFLAGCTSMRPSASLSAGQATALAVQLANDKASTICHRKPFLDGQPAAFVSGRWTWRELAPGDVEATVELAADGSTNSVAINILSEFF